MVIWCILPMRILARLLASSYKSTTTKRQVNTLMYSFLSYSLIRITVAGYVLWRNVFLLAHRFSSLPPLNRSQWSRSSPRRQLQLCVETQRLLVNPPISSPYKARRKVNVSTVRVPPIICKRHYTDSWLKHCGHVPKILVLEILNSYLRD